MAIKEIRNQIKCRMNLQHIQALFQYSQHFEKKDQSSYRQNSDIKILIAIVNVKEARFEIYK